MRTVVQENNNTIFTHAKVMHGIAMDKVQLVSPLPVIGNFPAEIAHVYIRNANLAVAEQHVVMPKCVRIKFFNKRRAILPERLSRLIDDMASSAGKHRLDFL